MRQVYWGTHCGGCGRALGKDEDPCPACGRARARLAPGVRLSRWLGLSSIGLLFVSLASAIAVAAAGSAASLWEALPLPIAFATGAAATAVGRRALGRIREDPRLMGERAAKRAAVAGSIGAFVGAGLFIGVLLFGTCVRLLEGS